jgi:glycogen synthase
MTFGIGKARKPIPSSLASSCFELDKGGCPVPGTGRGTGVKFAPYAFAALVEAVRRAILLHKQPKKWQKLMSHAMAGDFSWPASALEYEKLYPDI